MKMLLDTDFLIHLHKEIRGGKPRGARSFLAEHPTDVLQISLITWMEFAEGFATELEADCTAFLSNFLLIVPNADIAWTTSRLFRQLKQKGQPIGDHDVWIAATALAHDLPLVTNNVRHYQRIPGLQLLSF